MSTGPRTAEEHLNRIEDSLTLIGAKEALESLTALRATLKSAENTAGDNLCWIVDPSTAKALPEAEFLESCRRYRQQIADERGEVSGCRTIAQLEAKIAKLERKQGSPSIPSPSDESAANRESDAEILAWLDRNCGRERPFWYGQRTFRDAVLIAMRELKDRAALPNPESHQEDAPASNDLPKE